MARLIWRAMLYINAASGMATVRLNIILDEDLYRRIKRQLPPKRLRAFINEAVRPASLPT